MYKVLRSYSKKAERKHELTRSNQLNSTSNACSYGRGAENLHGMNADLLVPYNDHHNQQQLQNLESTKWNGGKSATTGATSLGIHGAFSESSSYEAREHFERKVKRVKKTRAERDSMRKSHKTKACELSSANIDLLSAKDALLQWAQDVTRGYPGVNIRNFSSSWRDGLAFNAILHRYRPNIINWSKVSDETTTVRDRLNNAFTAAEAEFGVSRLLDAEDVDLETPDEKSIITYVSSLYNALPHSTLVNKGSLADMLSRLTRGIGITNEKLDHILQRIEDAETKVETSRSIDLQQTIDGIIDDLLLLESPILEFFDDVEQLRQFRHPEANSFYQQVYGLEQRRQSYMTRLRTQFMTKLGNRSETILRESVERRETIRRSTFSRVEECIEWVRVRLDKLSEMEFDHALRELESMFEEHKVDNHDIQDFRQKVDECIARQAEVAAEDSHEYCELLTTLESEYQQLRDLSAGRMLDLDTLIAFIRGVELELVWIKERQDIEITRNWSDINRLDLPMLQNYYKQLLHEIELREPIFNDVHNKGAALVNQGHPANHIIEYYLRDMQRNWDYLLALSRCLEQHLRDANNLKTFMEDAAAAEEWMQKQGELLERKYSRSDFSLEEGEQMLRELNEINEILKKYHAVLMHLTERSCEISPLWQRGERVEQPISVTAIANNFIVEEGDECMLVDNSRQHSWVLQDTSGSDFTDYSVFYRIPPPDSRLTSYISRLRANFDKLRRLWEKKNRLVRINMVLNTMKQIRNWNLDTFASIPPDERGAIIKACNDDVQKLLDELDPNDPLAVRLQEELKLVNEHFLDLLNRLNRPKEPEVSRFDEEVAKLLKKLNEANRSLNDRVAQGVPRSLSDLERLISEHKNFEEILQGMDVDVSTIHELFRQIPNPTPTQRANHDLLNGLWEDVWELSRMYVERLKALEGVLNGISEVSDIVRQHEITLNSYDDLSASLDSLRGVHSQLLEMNMVLQQQQSIIDSLNRNIALLRQHASRTRQSSSHPDVDRLEDEIQNLTVRWENVCSQVTERMKSTERALQTMMVYRPEYDNELTWLIKVEETINNLRRPGDLHPEQYQQQLDQLVADYAQLQERTEAIENVNREGGKFIREGKSYDSRLSQYADNIVSVHGPVIRNEFRRSYSQPKNGVQQVTEELERLNRRFAQLSSLILERRNVVQVLIQNWKRKKQEEEDRSRIDEEEKRRAFEAARRKTLEDADRLRRERIAIEDARRVSEEVDRLKKAREAAGEEARRRAEDEARKRAEAEDEARRRAEGETRRRAEDEARRQKEAEEEEERRREEERKRMELERRKQQERDRKAKDEADRERERRKREEEEKRRKELEELERRRREEETRRKKIPDIRHGLQQTIVPEAFEVAEFEESVEVPDRAAFVEHEDEMQMYQEETITKTQFYEMEGVLHKQTGEILTFVEAVRQGLLDLHSGGGEFYDIVSGARISLEKAAELGYINGGFHEVLNARHGIWHPVTQQSLTLLEAIQLGLYDPDLRQLRDINTGEILSMYDSISRGIITLDTQHRLLKMGVLKLPPMSLEKALEQGVVNRETGQFTGRYTREAMSLKEAIYNGYIQIVFGKPNPMIAICLSDCIELGLIDGHSGEFKDKFTGETLLLRDAVSKQNSLINLHIPEIVNTDENIRITLGEAIVRNAINTRQSNFVDLQKSQSLPLHEAFSRDFIQKPLTLTEIYAKGMIDSTNKFIDAGTKRRHTLLEAIACGLIDADVRHIVDPVEKDVVSIAEALERGLLDSGGNIVGNHQNVYSIAEAVGECLLIARVRHTIFDVKGIKNTINKEYLTFNEAVNAGAIILQAERIVDLENRESYLLSDSADKDLIDPMLHQLLCSSFGLKKQSPHDCTVFRAVAKGLIDPVKGVFIDMKFNRELTPKQAYDEEYITLRSALQLSALFDIPSLLVSPSKKLDHKRRIHHPGQKYDVASDQIKVTLAEAMKQGLVDSRTHRFRQGGTEMSFEDALNQGLIHPSDEWIVPSKGDDAGPTIEERVSETVSETGQQLAPKFYPDKNIEETITTVKRVKKTETTALGGPGGVSVYRAITGGKGTVEVPADGFHISEAERLGYIDFIKGVVIHPNVDRSLSLQEAFDLGVLNGKVIKVRDPKKNKFIPITEAMEKEIMDKNGFIKTGGRMLNIHDAIEQKIVSVEHESLASVPSSAKKIIQFSADTGGIMTFRPVGDPFVEEFEQTWTFDGSTGELVDHVSDGRYTLDIALKSGKITAEDLRVKDALTGREMAFEEAEKWGIVDSKNYYYFDKRDNRRYSFSEAAKQHRIFLTGGVPENSGDSVHTTYKVQKRTEVSKKEAIACGPSAFVDQTLTKAVYSGLYDAESGKFTHPNTGKQINLKESIIKGLFNPYGTTIYDKLRQRNLSLLEAIDENIVDDSTGEVLDTASGRRMDLIKGIKEGIVRDSRTPDTLEGATVNGKLDLATGKYNAPDGRVISLQEALRLNLIEPKSVVVRDPASGDDLLYQMAVDKKIVNPVEGTIFNRNTNQTISFAQALTRGVLVGSGSRQSHSYTPKSSQPSKLIERKLELTPYSQPCERKVANIKDQRSIGAGRQEIVDLGGGKQVMVKVVRGEGGVEKGEYIDPSSGMKFTIQLHGDPFVTETKTIVKSTAQVQSVQLEPHAEFIGIDKIRDKRTGRVMSLQDAQRLGIAHVDKKGKQMTKTYSVFRSNIQNAISKGVVDAQGEKISLEDAIRAKLIDIGNLTYLNPKTGEALPLAQAANMGLLDVTLSEILSKGVCHPANGEKISTERAINLSIINVKTGEVMNPFTKERLTWLDILKPVYASLTMEGVYDPTKGYGVPVLSALIEGLIDANTGQYSNPITLEKISLNDATSKGLIDQETYKAITQPFFTDYRTKQQLNLIEAVKSKLIDPRNRTIQLDKELIIPIARATTEGKIPRLVGERLKKVDKLTFAEALGKGLIDVTQNKFTDQDSGRPMSINQAIEEGYIDTGKVEAMEGSNERNLANIINSEEFDENSGRIRDKKSGLYLTFKAAVERDIIDGDSLFHDVDSSQTICIREAINRGRVDADGKYIDQKTGCKINLREAVENGLIALFASPMQAAQAVTEAVKRRETEGYKFRFGNVDERRTTSSAPRFRDESTVLKLSQPYRAEPGLSVRMRSTSEAHSTGSRGRSLIDDPQGLADLQHEFLDDLIKKQFDIDERILENPATSRRISVREAAESGLLDVVTGEIVHPSSGRRYSIPRAVHMKLLQPDVAKHLMESLNMSMEELSVSTSYTVESPSALSPSDSTMKVWMKTVNWHGQPSELRQSDDPLAPYTTYSSNVRTSETSWVPHD